MLTTLPVRNAAQKLSSPIGFAVAILIPCHNEEAAIRKVVEDFRTSLPDAAILVYDNNSTDGTRQIARAAGGQVQLDLADRRVVGP